MAFEELARRQLERDHARTKAFPQLFAHKIARMRVSPLAYLRGAAPLFYELLRGDRELRDGPRGRGWIAGDLHIENFGAYRPYTHTADDALHAGKHEELEHATFNLNDFDDAVVGPWYFDVLRLTTSLALGARGFGADGTRTLDLCTSLVSSYVKHAFGERAMPAAPAPVAELIGRVLVRTRKQLLDARTEVVRGRRRFVRGPRYRPIARELAAEARRAFEKYAAKMAETVDPSHMKVLDVAFRVAGTGSLGGLRVAVLASGKGGVDGAWVFDLKEEGTPSATLLAGTPREKPARRVVDAMKACLAAPPRMLGTTKLGTRSMLARRLSPQEDKLDLTSMRPSDLDALAGYLGALAGAAHRRGAVAVPSKPWRERDQATILDRALSLAAVHEGAYLAMCRLTR